jgi:hypothetical protein
VIFSDGRAELVMSGRKTVTRRLVSDNPGSPYHYTRMPMERIAVQPGYGEKAIGYVTVLGVLIELVDLDMIAAMDRREVKREGFRSAAEFADTWAAMHGPDPVRIWRIEFTAFLPYLDRTK